MRKKTLIISIIVGAAIFLFFMYRVGLGEIGEIFKNVNLGYLALYAVVSAVGFMPQVMRWKTILKGYGKDISFWMLLRQTIAGFAVSYVTPAVRIGGEPVRAYMLEKEAGVDLRTGSSSIIIDKFIELIGSLIFGAVGLILLIFVPGIPFWFKVALGGLILYGFYGLFVVYYRTITDRGSFSELFMRWGFYRIKRISGFVHTLEDVEGRLKKFFVENKKEFFVSFSHYVIYGLLAILEFKFLLLGLGIDASLVVIILALTVLGLTYFIPVPAALGVLEAGQTGLFYALKGQGSIGFVLSLVARIRNLIFVAIGFSLIAYFSGGVVQKKLDVIEEKKKRKKRRKRLKRKNEKEIHK